MKGSSSTGSAGLPLFSTRNSSLGELYFIVRDRTEPRRSIIQSQWVLRSETSGYRYFNFCSLFREPALEPETKRALAPRTLFIGLPRFELGLKRPKRLVLAVTLQPELRKIVIARKHKPFEMTGRTWYSPAISPTLNSVLSSIQKREEIRTSA